VKIVVCIKRVVDTETRVKIGADGRAIDAAGVQTIMAPYDEMALEKALQWKEAGTATSVTALTVGPAEASKELRTALAMGADDAVHVVVERIGDASATAAALAKVVKERSFDLVLCGKQATDVDDAAVGPMLAARLGWPCVAFVFAMEPGQGVVTVRREIEGETEVLEVDLPCVLTAQKGLAEARLPGLKGIMAAKKKPLATVQGDAPESLTEQVGLALPPARSAPTAIPPTPEGMRTLLHALRNDKKVL
jgi:electron transfer flavoprotein beta subunit